MIQLYPKFGFQIAVKSLKQNQNNLYRMFLYYKTIVSRKMKYRESQND